MSIVEKYRERIAHLSTIVNDSEPIMEQRHGKIIRFHLVLAERLTDEQLNDYLIKENPVAYTELGQLIRLIERK